MNISKSAFIFLRFLQRDAYIYKQRVTTYIINYGILYPLLYACAIGYLLPKVMFNNDDPTQASALLIGHILVIVLVFANTLNVGLVFDLENERYIDYQLTLLNPRLIIVERILFASLFTFAITIPFYPIAKLMLGAHFVTTAMSWTQTFLLLYVSSLCCAAYTQFTACIVPSSRSLRSFWMRINFALITLGGLFIPWSVIHQFSPALSYAILLNPLLYITEGLRKAVLQGPTYFSVWLCVTALLAFAVIFTLLAWYYFKKRVDHI